MGDEFQIYYFDVKKGYLLFWSGDHWDDMVYELHEAKKKWPCVKMEWRGSCED